MRAKIIIDKNEVISKIDDRMYGSFVEHLGRSIYGGIYAPDHETADEQGFRQDVLEEVKKLNVPVFRYPGGNFVSNYRWEDGTGDKAKRPKRLGLAWSTVETNQVGIDEFQEWARRAGGEVMLAVNLGTRGPEEACNLVEYCNSTTDTYYAEMRRKNGFEKPFGIKLWCLGNEMDAPWQIGAKSPEEYAHVARETAKLMKRVDPSIELVACGSTGPAIETFGTWDKAVLREAYEYIDYISLHNYCRNETRNTKDFLGSSLVVDNYIEQVSGFCDEIQKEKGTDKKIMLSFDEWNVWYHSREQDQKIEKWQKAPHLLEDIYTLEDAVVDGSVLITLLRHADRIKIACLAQMVNVIAPIMTEDNGGVWLQTIYYPFYYTSKYGRGTALRTENRCETYHSSLAENIPYIDSVAVLSEDGDQLALFFVNKSLNQECVIDISLNHFQQFCPVKHISLEGNDLQAVNSAENPYNIIPVEKRITDKITAAPVSWNMVLFQKA
ncbi:MAG: alpha-N-arabinofuranosidase [Candidatus Choladocola sp.]|nr:alpha-N-arabinofuranosidase [Candidatus Choladocola sp.]